MRVLAWRTALPPRDLAAVASGPSTGAGGGRVGGAAATGGGWWPTVASRTGGGTGCVGKEGGVVWWVGRRAVFRMSNSALAAPAVAARSLFSLIPPRTHAHTLHPLPPPHLGLARQLARKRAHRRGARRGGRGADPRKRGRRRPVVVGNVDQGGARHCVCACACACNRPLREGESGAFSFFLFCFTHLTVFFCARPLSPPHAHKHPHEARRKAHPGACAPQPGVCVAGGGQRRAACSRMPSPRFRNPSSPGRRPPPRRRLQRPPCQNRAPGPAHRAHSARSDGRGGVAHGRRALCDHAARAPARPLGLPGPRSPGVAGGAVVRGGHRLYEWYLRQLQAGGG